MADDYNVVLTAKLDAMLAKMVAMESVVASPHSNIPIPDPSIITAQQIEALRQEIRRDIAAEHNLVHMRLDGMDKATTLLSDHVVACPSKNEIDRLFSDRLALMLEKLTGLKNESDQKFEGIRLQFVERDVRIDHDAESNRTMVEQASVASKTAIDAAFLANQKAADANAEYVEKSITKSETATKEAIAGLGALFEKQFGSVQDKIGALTSRIDRGEGIDRGAIDNKTESRAQIDSSMKMFMVFLTAAAVLSPIIVAFVLHVTPASTIAPVPAAVAVVPVQPK